MRREGLRKIRSRQRLWDIMQWQYVSKQYLWKNTLAACDCSWCRVLKDGKRRDRRRARRLAKLQIKISL